MSRTLRSLAVAGAVVMSAGVGIAPVAQAYSAPAAAVASVPAVAKPTIRVAVSNARPDVGQRVTFSAAVTGAPAKTSVTFQELIDSKWVTGIVVKTDAKGRAAAVAPIVRGGLSKIRALAKVGKSLVSTSVPMTAYRWIDLDIDAGASVGKVVGVVKRNGRTEGGWSAALTSTKTTDDAIAMSGWRVDRTCTTVRGRAFSSTPGAKFLVALGKDPGNNTATEISGSGEWPLSADVRGSQTVMIAAAIANGSGVVSVVKPQVRCPWR